MRRIFNKSIRGTEVHLPIDPDLATPKPPSTRAPFGPVELGLVGLGGTLGTLARYEAQLHWPDLNGHFPWTIFVVNVSGSLLLGAILSALVRLDRMGGARLFACVGVLGGWTTMSTLAVRIDTAVSSHHFSLALTYAATSLTAGVVASGVGMWFTHRLLGDRAT